MMTTPSTIPAVRVTNVTRAYTVNNEQVLALRGVSLTVEEGAFIALMGRSGSGKTTLLNMIGGLDQPSTLSSVILGFGNVSPLGYSTRWR